MLHLDCTLLPSCVSLQNIRAEVHGSQQNDNMGYLVICLYCMLVANIPDGI